MAVTEKTRRRRMAMKKADLIVEIERLEARNHERSTADEGINAPVVTKGDGGVTAAIDASRLAEMENELRESEQRFTAVFENMPAVAFLRDLEGRFTLINKSYETTYGVSRTDVLGQRLSDVFPRATAKLFSDQDEEVLRTGQAIHNEESIPISGRKRHFDRVRYPVSNDNGEVVAIGGIEFDITERKIAEQAHQSSEALLHTIFESINYGVLLLDADLNIRMANRAYREIWSLPEEIFANQPSFREVLVLARQNGFYLVPNEEWGDYVEARLAELRSETTSEREIELPNGRTLHFESIPLPDGYRILNYFDITTRKQAERDLAEQKELLDVVSENMNHGFLLLDENMVVTAFNEQERQGMLLPDDVLFTGARFENIAKYCKERGDPGTGASKRDAEERWRNVREKGGRTQFEYVRFDGVIYETWRQSVPGVGILQTSTNITERKRAEQELAEKEAQLRIVLDNMPGGIRYVDKDKRYVFFNSRYLEMYDFPEGLLKVGDSNRVENLFQAERGDFGPGSPDELTDAWLGELPVDTEPTSWERVTPRGETLQVNTAPTPDGGVVNIVTDITERKTAERMLEIAKNEAEAASDLISMIFKNISQGICVLDEEGQILACNARWAELTDVPESLVSPLPHLREVIRFQIERGRHPQLTGSLDERIETRLSEIMNLKDGQIHKYETSTGRFLEIQSSRVSQGRRIDTFTDVTGYQLQQSLLAEAKDHAEEANRSKSAFLASMSHEIRTPLSGITGFLELLQYSKLDDDQRSMVRSVNLSARYLIDLIGDVLDFSKIEAGHLDLRLEQVSPRSLLDEAVSVVAPLAQEKLVDLYSQLSPRTPRWIEADPVRLRQVLVNLVGNAVKFSERGAVHVDVFPEKREAAGGWRIRFEVSDTGIGFDPVLTPDLFGEFRQADDSTTRRFGGTGLGLAISKRLVEMMSGDIGYDAEPDRGALFWFTLPSHEPPTDALEPVQESGLSVLLLGDGGDVEMEVADLIRAAGYIVELADQSDFLDGRKFDAVVLIDGAPEPAAEELKRLSTTRILLTTAWGFKAKNNALWAGYTHVLPQDRWMSSLIHHIGDAARLMGAPTQVDSDDELANNFTNLLDPAIAGLPILVIDDIEMNRQIAGRQLDRLNLPQEFATNGEEGLAKTRENRYAAVIVDLSMPVMDGYEFTKTFRLWEKQNLEEDARRTPVVALTANVTADDAEKCIAAGMDDYMSKPLTMASLTMMLLKWLGRDENARRPDRTSEKVTEAPSVDESGMSDPDRSPIEFAELAEILGSSDIEVQRGFIREFLMHVSGFMVSLDAALAARDRNAARAAAHSACGSAKYVCASLLAGTYFNIEQKAATASWEELSSLVETAKAHISDVEALIE